MRLEKRQILEVSVRVRILEGIINFGPIIIDIQ